MTLDTATIANQILRSLPLTTRWVVGSSPLDFDFQLGHSGLAELEEMDAEFGDTSPQEFLVFGESDYCEGGGARPWICVGYIFRACHEANGIRSWIWGLSAAVQGTWFAIFAMLVLMGSDELFSLFILLPWWTASFVGSIWAFFNNKDVNVHQWHTHVIDENSKTIE